MATWNSKEINEKYYELIKKIIKLPRLPKNIYNPGIIPMFIYAIDYHNDPLILNLFLLKIFGDNYFKEVCENGFFINHPN